MKTRGLTAAWLTMPLAAAAVAAGVVAAGVVAVVLAESPAAAARAWVGVYKGWAAFRDDAPSRCYALSAPQPIARGAFAAVGSWPDRRVAGQVHVRFGRAARPGSAVLLTIDDAVFQLVGRGADAWAPSPAVDRAIIAAMRTGVAMTVTARDRQGNMMTFAYGLTGAASAIDAAALACRPR